MGCAMMAAIESEPDGHSDLLNGVPEWFEGWEQALSRFRPDSELCRLNERSGQALKVSPVLWDVLQEALRAARLSEGLVNPCMLNDLENAGYTESFEIIRCRPGDSAAACPAATRTPWSQIEVNSRSYMVRMPAGIRLDFGGVAKGWAADRALRRLSTHGAALVDAGGDIAAGSPPAGQPGWPVAIANPFFPSAPLGLLCLRNAGVATSGRDYRKWVQNGWARHHILDPRTGLPAETDILTATVVAPSARTAEMAAKTILILGSRLGLNWLSGQHACAAYLVLEDGTTVQSSNFRTYMWSSS